MKKLLLALTAMSIVAASAAFAGEACKKCSGADKDAACTCKSCDKEKSCDKDKAADKGSAEKKK